MAKKKSRSTKLRQKQFTTTNKHTTVNAKKQPPNEDWLHAIRNAKQFLAEPVEPKTELIEGLLYTQEIFEVHAWRGVAKTRFVTGLADALTTKKPFLGCKVLNKYRVLIVDGELPTTSLQKIFADAGIESERLLVVGSEILYKLIHRTMNLTHLDDQRKFFALLNALGKKLKPDVIILDGWTSLFEVDENDRDERQINAQNFLKKLRFEGYTIGLVVHEGKTGMQRGHSGIEDCLDLALGLEGKNQPGEPAKIQLEFTKDRFERPAIKRLQDSVWELRTLWTLVATAKDKPKPKLKMLGSWKWNEYMKWIDANKPREQQEIATAFKVSKGAVSQVLSIPRSLGFLKKDSMEFTDAGRQWMETTR